MPRVNADYIPALRLHKQSMQGIVTLSYRDHLLGPFGSPESKVRYHQLVAEWLANGRKPLDAVHSEPSPASRSVHTISELASAYKRHVADYYRDSNGKPTSEVYNIGSCVEIVQSLFGAELVDDFTPSKLKEVRARMIKRGWVRTSVNKNINRLRAMFSWGVENEVVAAATIASLREVKGLKRGRTEAPDSDPVKPAHGAYIDAIRPHVASPVWALVQAMVINVTMRANASRETRIVVRKREVESRRDRAKLYASEENREGLLACARRSPSSVLKGGP